MRNKPDGFLLAGWLFADLLLALAVLFSVSNATVLPPRPSASPIPTVSRTPARTTPAPTRSTPSPGLSVLPVCRRLDLPIDGLLRGDPDAVAQVVDILSNKLEDLRGQTVAIVLTFGSAESNVTATAVSAEVNRILRSATLSARLGPVFAGAQTRDYIVAPAPRGPVYLELFLPADSARRLPSDECPH